MARVLHVIRSLDPGGAERVVMEHAIAHDRSRYQPEVCCVLGEGELAAGVRGAGVPVHVLCRRGSGDAAAALRLARLVRRGGFDVVHNHNSTPVKVGVPAAILGGARVVLRTEHNVSLPRGRLWPLLSRLAALREDAQIAVSRAVLESHVRERLIPARRFVTVWNGIDPARFDVPDDRSRVRHELGLGDDEFVCLTVGSLTPKKNHGDLLEAARIVHRARPDVRFLVAGGGPLREDLAERARDLGLAETVLFLGQRNDVPRLLGASDAFVLSSSWEGLPITVLEAMAAGVPCVVTAVGGVSEILTNGVSGCTVRPNDPGDLARQIELLAANPDLRSRLADRARSAFREGLTAAAMVRQTEALYDLARAGRTDLAPEGRIKVVYAIGQLGLGGAERQLLELVTRLPRSLFEPMVCSLGDLGPMGEAMGRAGVRVVALRKRSGIFSSCTFALWRLLMAERPAVLHTYLFSAGWRGLVAGTLARVPVRVSSVRNVNIHATFLPELFERIMAPFTDLVIANARSVKEYVARVHGIRAGRIHVVYNGISMERIEKCLGGRAAAPAGCALGSAGTVVMVASLTPKKDHRTFLAAAAIVRRELPDVRFLVVGGGPLRAELEARADELGLADAVAFAGEVEDAAALLSAADVSVLTSLKEGCSNVVIESMAAGTPVVATRVGGNPELVEEAVTGFLVPAGDAEGVARRVCELLADQDLRTRMGEAGKARARKLFAAERMVEDTTALYLASLRSRLPALVAWVEATEARGGSRGTLEPTSAGRSSLADRA